RHGGVVLNESAQRTALAEQVPLPDHLVQSAGAHPYRQRLLGAVGLGSGVVEQCFGHTSSLVRRPVRFRRRLPAAAGAHPVPAGGRRDARRRSHQAASPIPPPSSAPPTVSENQCTPRYIRLHAMTAVNAAPTSSTGTRTRSGQTAAAQTTSTAANAVCPDG